VIQRDLQWWVAKENVAQFQAHLKNCPDDIHVWAAEMYANKAWLENLGMKPADLPYIEFPEYV
jgi:hypothetical protein